MFFNNYQFLKNKETLLLILLILISVLVRIPVILILGDTSLENEWQHLVHNLVTHGKLVYQNLDGFLLPNLWMPPLYAYYLYFFTFFNLESQNYIILVLVSQILLASISVAIFYKINKFFFTQTTSFYSSLILSLFPLYIYASSQISSISLQVFLTILYFYLFFQLIKKKNILSIFFFSFVSGLLILLRGEFWAIFILSLFYLFFFSKVSIKKLFLIFLISLITASPYLIRNIVIFEKLTVLESFGYNLWKGNHPQAKKISRVEGSEIVNENLLKQIYAIPKDKFYRINYDKFFLDQAIKNISKDPLGYIVFFIKKAFSLFFIIIGSMDQRYWHPLHYIPVLLIGITSLIGIILSNKKSSEFNYLFFIFLLNIFVYSTFSILPRYKLIILPLQIIFTSVLIEYIKKKFFNQRKDN